MKGKWYGITTLVFLLFGCHGPDHENPVHKSSPEKAVKEVAWSYEGSTGPEFWGDLSPNNALCKDGREQSPIDLVGPFTEGASQLSFNYAAVPLKIIDNGHTIEARIDAGNGSIDVAGERFDLIQFHFHHRSEHTVAGKDYEMVVHLVHQNETGGLAVVGVFFTAGEANPVVGSIWENLPDQQGEVKTIDGISINPAGLLPADPEHFAYNGSLTTPRCGEGVLWHVMTTPIEVSTEQIGIFAAIYSNNRRPVQPLGERTIGLRK